MTLKEPGRHDQSEDRIAQKLQPLVVVFQTSFVRERAVRQGLLEQGAVPEAVAEARLEILDRVRQG